MECRLRDTERQGHCRHCAHLKASPRAGSTKFECSGDKRELQVARSKWPILAAPSADEGAEAPLLHRITAPRPHPDLTSAGTQVGQWRVPLLERLGRPEVAWSAQSPLSHPRLKTCTPQERSITPRRSRGSARRCSSGSLDLEPMNVGEILWRLFVITLDGNSKSSSAMV